MISSFLRVIDWFDCVALLGSWSWLSNHLIIRQRSGLDYQALWYSSFLRWLMIIMIISFTKRLLITTTVFVPFLLPTSWHCRLLVFPVCVIIIGEVSFVITSRQCHIDWCLQCVFQGLVHGPLLESIMLFSNWKEDSLYPTSRCRVTMELSPHPNDIRVRWAYPDRRASQYWKMTSRLNLSLEM